MLTLKAKRGRRTESFNPTRSGGLRVRCSRWRLVHARRPREALRKAVGISCR